MTREEIKKLVENLLVKMDFIGEVVVAETETLLKISVTIQNDQSLLIGHDGINLAAFQHLVRLLARSKTLQEGEMHKEIYLDVNQYWQEKEKKLSHDALDKAKNVLETGEEYLFPPMDAHNRKVIHGAVIGMDRIQSESIGNGRERRVRLYRIEL